MEPCFGIECINSLVDCGKYGRQVCQLGIPTDQTITVSHERGLKIVRTFKRSLLNASQLL